MEGLFLRPFYCRRFVQRLRLTKGLFYDLLTFARLVLVIEPVWPRWEIIFRDKNGRADLLWDATVPWEGWIVSNATVALVSEILSEKALRCIALLFSNYSIDQDGI